jgi:hypothetical protein
MNGMTFACHHAMIMACMPGCMIFWSRYCMVVRTCSIGRKVLERPGLVHEVHSIGHCCRSDVTIILLRRREECGVILGLLRRPLHG